MNEYRIKASFEEKVFKFSMKSEEKGIFLLKILEIEFKIIDISCYSVIFNNFDICGKLKNETILKVFGNITNIKLLITDPIDEAEKMDILKDIQNILVKINNQFENESLEKSFKMFFHNIHEIFLKYFSFVKECQDLHNDTISILKFILRNRCSLKTNEVKNILEKKKYLDLHEINIIFHQLSISIYDQHKLENYANKCYIRFEKDIRNPKEIVTKEDIIIFAQESKVKLCEEERKKLTNEIPIKIIGSIINKEKEPIKDAIISVNKRQITISNIFGLFIINIPICLKPSEYILEFFHQDYAYSQKRLLIEENILDVIDMEINLLKFKKNSYEIFEEWTDRKIILPDSNFIIDFPVKCFDQKFKMTIAELNADSNELVCFPGDFSAVSLSNEEIYLESFNSVYIKFENSNEKKVKLQKEVSVSFNISEEKSPMSFVTFWKFNKKMGKWKEMNSTRSSSFISTNIRRGGWYNVDRKLNTRLFNGQIPRSLPSSAAYSFVSFKGLDFNCIFSTYSKKDGSFSIPLINEHRKNTYFATLNHHGNKEICGPFSSKNNEIDLLSNKKITFKDINEKEKEFEQLKIQLKEEIKQEETYFQDFQHIVSQIDSKKNAEIKFSKVEKGLVTGQFNILEENGKTTLVDLFQTKVLIFEIFIKMKEINEQATIYLLDDTRKIIRPIKNGSPNTQFLSTETRKINSIEHPSTLLLSLIFDSKPETGFIRKEDLFNLNENDDYMRKNSMIGVRILILNLSMINLMNMETVLTEKACLFETMTNPTQDFDIKLNNASILVIISSHKQILTDKNIQSIIDFYQKGNSLYIFGDNDPLFVDANLITQKLFQLKLSGNDYGDKVVSKVSSLDNILKTGFDASCPLFHGLNSLYEGVTLSHVVDLSGKSIRDKEECNGFKPVLWGTENNVICHVILYVRIKAHY